MERAQQRYHTEVQACHGARYEPAQKAWKQKARSRQAQTQQAQHRKQKARARKAQQARTQRRQQKQQAREQQTQRMQRQQDRARQMKQAQTQQRQQAREKQTRQTQTQRKMKRWQVANRNGEVQEMESRGQRRVQGEKEKGGERARTVRSRMGRQESRRGVKQEQKNWNRHVNWTRRRQGYSAGQTEQPTVEPLMQKRECA